jgi:hypothetical protein
MADQRVSECPATTTLADTDLMPLSKDAGGSFDSYKITMANAMQGFKKLIVQVKTASYLLDVADDIVICNKTTAMNITLPVAAGSGKIFNIKNINTGAVTVIADTTGTADTIDNEATQTIAQWDSMTIVDYVVNKWAII